MGGCFRHRDQARDPPERLVVGGGDDALLRDKAVQLLELGQAQSRQDVVEPVIVACLGVEVLDVVLGLSRQVGGVTRQFRVRGRQHPAAAAGDHLVAVEAEGRRVAEGPDVPAPAADTHGFGGVHHDLETVPAGGRHEPFDVAGEAQQVDRDDRAHAPAGALVDATALLLAAFLGEETFRLIGIELPGPRLGVDEDGVGPAVAHGVGGRDEGEVGDDDLVAGFHSDRQQGDVERRGPVDGRDGMRDADIGGEGLLELGHEGPGRGDPARVQAFLDVAPLIAAQEGLGESQRGAGPCAGSLHFFQEATSRWAVAKSSGLPMSSQYSWIGKLATRLFFLTRRPMRSVISKRRPFGMSRQAEGSSRYIPAQTKNSKVGFSLILLIRAASDSTMP